MAWHEREGVPETGTAEWLGTRTGDSGKLREKAADSVNATVSWSMGTRTSPVSGVSREDSAAHSKWISDYLSSGGLSDEFEIMAGTYFSKGAKPEDAFRIFKEAKESLRGKIPDDVLDQRCFLGFSKFLAKYGELGAVESMNAAKIAKTLSEYKEAIDKSMVIMEVDEKGFIIGANPKAEETSGYRADELVGMHTSRQNSGYHWADFWESMWQSIGKGEVWRGEIRNVSKFGKGFWFDTTIVPMKDADGKFQKYLVVRNDITKQKELELSLKEKQRELQDLYEQMRELASTDQLTGLRNRGLFDTDLSEKISKLRRNGDGLSLVMFDVDDFKKVNDTYGHPGGDDVLRFVGKVLKTGLRDHDVGYRYGGEEFVVLIQWGSESAFAMAERLRRSFEERSKVQIPFTVSVGVAEYVPGESAESFIKRADNGLYEAKKRGKNWVFAITADEVVDVSAHENARKSVERSESERRSDVPWRREGDVRGDSWDRRKR